jgi:mono/diheme cytochrome c family protein
MGLRRENNLPLLSAGAGLTLAILIAFQVYLLREPARLQSDAVRDLQESVDAGEGIFAEHCSTCHGDRGQGGIGPALNSKSLLRSVGDDQLFGLVRTGVPGTAMPAWAQSFGGPLTDEQVRQVVAFVRAWEPDAVEVVPLGPAPDPQRGSEIFESICFACHGSQGKGTEAAPALNDPQLLASFDDDWFKDTISQGRPSRGMPTWGTVLSPSQIDDLIALIGFWREGETASLGEPAELSAEQLFAVNCEGCHGAAGIGGFAPALFDNTFVIDSTDSELVDFMLAGRPGTAMPSFEGRMAPDELVAIAALLLTWQP